MFAVGSIGAVMLVAAGLTLLLDGPLSGVFAVLTIVAAYVFITTGLQGRDATTRIIDLIRLDDLAADRAADD